MFLMQVESNGDKYIEGVFSTLNNTNIHIKKTTPNVCPYLIG